MPRGLASWSFTVGEIGKVFSRNGYNLKEEDLQPVAGGVTYAGRRTS